ncbi:Tmem108 [Phodopus roborovskii]|uniref:Tmem108 protein n=1 Tax=Phodopus roborovskii TaxID=109678 RepID=A0AAU9YRJ8_PHORO|nr:Tmem108 [Phodopus roborovskii]
MTSIPPLSSIGCWLVTELWEAVPSGVMDLISPAVEPMISGHFWNPPGDGLS